MRAIRVHISGDERRLMMEDVPTPEPRPDQVLVRASAIGVNRADLGRGAVGGAATGEPYIPGLDVGGTIEAVGSEVSGWNEGDPVIALARSAYAEFVPSRAVLAYRLPEGMSMVDGASIPCVFLTAWYGIRKLGRMQPGETVLVHAAGSGVGTAAIQIARASGARVLTTAGSDAKVARGLELGAEGGINYSTQDVTAELQRLTDGRGVDVVLDSVGGAVFDATMKALAEGGRVVNVGAPAGPRSEQDQSAMEARGQSVQQSGVFNDAAEDAEGAGWAQLKAWFEDGTVKPIVDRVLPWEEAESAQRLLSERVIFGKIVLTVGS
jgi:NADPH2:quinone reductase